MTIPVTGGAGYIDSHNVKYLLDRGHDVLVLDDLSGGFRDAVPDELLIESNIGDAVLLDKLFTEHQIDVAMNFASVAQGLEDCLYLSNMNALRDWGHAKDYVRMQWLMLQQEQPEDFVIATGHQVSVRDFVRMAAGELGISLRFEGEGIEEKGIVEEVEGDKAPAVKVGDVVVAVDPHYFRPTEVDTLLGDATRAKEKLGWEPKISVQKMCAEMVAHDLEEARRHALLKDHGYDIPVQVEK